jgi:RNA 2',3'-cyclic 3'-phosphodiesterase
VAKSRTFIAVAASSEVRRSALGLMHQLRPVAGDVKWVAAENLHWTLQFLGEVDDLQLPEVCDRVAAAAAEIEAFGLAARGAGAFPSADRPRTLWLGAGAGGNDMIALQAAIERSLSEFGFRGESRRFVPHVTLGRAGRGRPPASLAAELAALADFDAGTMLVDEVTVYASQLTREGPIYDVLSHAPLAG